MWDQTQVLQKAWKWNLLSRVQLLVIPWTVTVHGIHHTRILEKPFPSPGNVPNPGIKPRSPWLSRNWSPGILEWVAFPFSSRSSRPRNQSGVSCISGGFFTNWAIWETLLQGSRALFNTDSTGGGMCGDNHEIRTDGNTNNFHQLGIPASVWWLWSARFLQDKTLSPQLFGVNQPNCLQ